RHRWVDTGFRSAPDPTVQIAAANMMAAPPAIHAWHSSSGRANCTSCDIGSGGRSPTYRRSQYTFAMAKPTAAIQLIVIIHPGSFTFGDSVIDDTSIVGDVCIPDPCASG